jgi:hypothetical protein
VLTFWNTNPSYTINLFQQQTLLKLQIILRHFQTLTYRYTSTFHIFSNDISKLLLTGTRVPSTSFPTPLERSFLTLSYIPGGSILLLLSSPTTFWHDKLLLILILSSYFSVQLQLILRSSWVLFSSQASVLIVEC